MQQDLLKKEYQIIIPACMAFGFGYWRWCIAFRIFNESMPECIAFPQREKNFATPIHIYFIHIQMYKRENHEHQYSGPILLSNLNGI